jgi:hypothetical protein
VHPLCHCSGASTLTKEQIEPFLLTAKVVKSEQAKKGINRYSRRLFLRQLSKQFADALTMDRHARSRETGDSRKAKTIVFTSFLPISARFAE